MKIVTIIIQPDKLEDVKDALYAAQVTGITVSRVSGYGKQKPTEGLYRGVKVSPGLIPKIRLDIACNDDLVELICDVVLKAAAHGKGKTGDGKIFIRNLEDCIRIRTGERGEKAL